MPVYKCDPSVTETEHSLLEPASNCWRIERAGRASLVVDAEDYFKLARQAIIGARSQILIMGWDLDTRICLDRDPKGEAPDCLGPLISWASKKRPDLHIYILAWSGEAYRYLGRGSTIFRLGQWARRKNIHFKLDGKHPREASHHQKILVIDDALAFCGGIDIAGSRWDTRAHRDKDPGRRRPTTGRRYHPWHDMTMAVDGKAAEALGDLGRIRWKAAGGDTLPTARSGSDPWPERLEPQFRDVDVGISRTRGQTGPLAEVREIEKLFLDMIAAARRHIYVEQQYFASRVVAEAVAKRLSESDGPEVVIVNPRTGEGWLDDKVMSSARHELMRVLNGCPHAHRFRIYYPVTKAGADIYVHAKIMIVDDVMLRVGSANMNNRSMGLDSECDVTIDSRRGHDPAVPKKIAQIRCDLMAEHLGCRSEEVRRVFEETGSLIATIERLRGGGRSLRPLEPEEPGKLGKLVARSEIADPEGGCDPFEPTAQHKLLGRLKRIRNRRG